MIMSYTTTPNSYQYVMCLAIAQTTTLTVDDPVPRSHRPISYIGWIAMQYRTVVNTRPVMDQQLLCYNIMQLASKVPRLS